MPTEMPPGRWAAELTRVLNAAYGSERFPVDVEGFALAYSKQRWPEDPILKIEPDDLEDFEGALLPVGRPRRGWGILLNENGSPGRRRFTAAHEFGHYLLHRPLLPDGVQCGEEAVRGEGRDIEREADRFAAAFLMPLDDMRRRIGPASRPTMDDLAHCAERYGVSLTAAILRWLEYTERRAIMVVSREDFALWARSSEAAARSRRVIRTAATPFEMPSLSCAVRRIVGEEARAGISHPAGVWFDEPVQEMAIASERHDQVITVLVMDGPRRGASTAGDQVPDLLDLFTS